MIEHHELFTEKTSSYKIMGEKIGMKGLNLFEILMLLTVTLIILMAFFSVTLNFAA
jgi:hypothetical protein